MSQPLPAALACLACAALLPITARAFERPQLPGMLTRIQAAPVNEGSGLCPSVRHKGVFWTHNDSGDGPILYAIHLDGSLVATYKVEGAKARDWEDIDISSDGVLYIADVGNNNHKRTDLTIYTVAEPEELVDEGTLKVQTAIPVTYPDGKYNCEALFLDAEGTPALITKDPGPARIYRLGKEGWEFEQELPTPDVVTGADLSDDHRLAVSTYLGFVVFKRDDEGTWTQSHRTFAVLEQCEAVCWHNDALLLTSEQRALFRFIPDEGKPEDSAFHRYAWDPADGERTYAPVGDGRVEAKSLDFRFHTEDDKVILTLQAPWKEHSGRGVFLFSSAPPGERTQAGPAEHQIDIVCRNGRLRLRTRQFGRPGQAMKDVELPVSLEKQDNEHIQLHFSGDWLETQKAFGCYFFGFDTDTVGWPYSYYRLHGHPLLWAERKADSARPTAPAD